MSNPSFLLCLLLFLTCNRQAVTDIQDYIEPGPQLDLEIVHYCYDAECLPIQPMLIPVQMRNVSDSTAQHNIDFLNKAFAASYIFFELDTTHIYPTNLTIPELQANGYDLYFAWAAQVNTDTLSIYYLDGDSQCDQSGCVRTAGFSIIGSTRYNQVVISQSDSLNPITLTHELGHFFGLRHLYDESEDIIDTPHDPLDPATIINYYTCEAENGILINNFMTTYKPCYFREYSFTPGQHERMYVVGRSVKNMAK